MILYQLYQSVLDKNHVFIFFENLCTILDFDFKFIRNTKMEKCVIPIHKKNINSVVFEKFDIFCIVYVSNNKLFSFIPLLEYSKFGEFDRISLMGIDKHFDS